MMTFLILVLILVCINAAMIFTSLYGVRKSTHTSKKGYAETTVSKIYPLDLFTPDYKKAV